METEQLRGANAVPEGEEVLDTRLASELGIHRLYHGSEFVDCRQVRTSYHGVAVHCMQAEDCGQSGQGWVQAVGLLPKRTFCPEESHH